MYLLTQTPGRFLLEPDRRIYIHMDEPRSKIQELRREYEGAPLRRTELAATPMDQFSRWFGESVASGMREPNAFTLSTLGLDGIPTSRTLLMKDYDASGVRFFTNYESRKAREMAAHPAVAILFFWKEVERQVHFRGRVEKTSREASEAYFFSRPYGSRIGAWASLQSQEIPDRAWLEERVAALEKQYPDTCAPDCVPLPDYWGGYLLVPESVEFWQGQSDRKHDRFLYTRDGADWKAARLSP